MRDMNPQARIALQQALDAAVNARRDQGVPGHDYEAKLGSQIYATDGSSLLPSARAPQRALTRLAGAESASPFRHLTGRSHAVHPDAQALPMIRLPVRAATQDQE